MGGKNKRHFMLESVMAATLCWERGSAFKAELLWYWNALPHSQMRREKLIDYDSLSSAANNDEHLAKKTVKRSKVHVIWSSYDLGNRLFTRVEDLRAILMKPLIISVPIRFFKRSWLHRGNGCKLGKNTIAILICTIFEQYRPVRRCAGPL